MRPQACCLGSRAPKSEPMWREGLVLLTLFMAMIIAIAKTIEPCKAYDGDYDQCQCNENPCMRWKHRADPCASADRSNYRHYDGCEIHFGLSVLPVGRTYGLGLLGLFFCSVFHGFILHLFNDKYIIANINIKVKFCLT